MPPIRVFISGAMANHELDVDRESARYAIDTLAPDFTAFAYEPFPESRKPPLEHDAKERGQQEIERSDALILVVGRSVSEFCIWELKFARRLGMPCIVFARATAAQKSRLRRFLAGCPCTVETYVDPAGDLTERIQEFCRSLLSSPDEKRQVVVHTKQVWHRLLAELLHRPGDVFELSSRKFEELLAEIIASFGYTTSLTPNTRDGGYDVLAVRREPLFPSRFLVEAKLWLPPRKVGRPVIQAVYGVGMADNCNGVMVVTPTTFAQDARSYLDEKRLKDYVRLVDGKDLPSLYKHYLEGGDRNELSELEY